MIRVKGIFATLRTGILEYLKLEKRLKGERFQSVKGECVI